MTELPERPIFHFRRASRVRVDPGNRASESTRK